MTIAATPATLPHPSLWPHRLVVIGIALVLFFVACALPGLHGLKNKATPDTSYGFNLVLVGWCAILVGQFAWLANLFLPLAALLLVFRLWITAAVAALLGFLIALHAFSFLHRELPADEGNVNKIVYTSLGAGYYVWLAAFLALALGAVVLRLLDTPRPPPASLPPPPGPTLPA
jgi:hypothetical protein